MAVAVDEAFFRHMDSMNVVEEVADCDVAWFVMGFDESGDGRARLVRRALHLTTLDETLGGLIAAEVVTKSEFESLLIDKTDQISASGQPE